MYLAMRRNSPLTNAQPGMRGVVQRPVQKPIRIFLNSLRFLCGFGFSVRVSGESGMRVRNFLNWRSPKMKFLNRALYREYLRWCRAQCLPLFCFLHFSFKSYNERAVKPSYDCYTLQLCQTATQHSEASFFDRQTDELDSVNKLKERTSARWDNFLSETSETAH